MKYDVLYRVIGRMSVFGNTIRPLLAGSRKSVLANEQHDKTGLVCSDGKPEIWCDGNPVFFVGYPSLAHSFWRAQELSIFKANASLLERPVADFGCGDGSFAALLFKKLDFGIDNDPAALTAAQKLDLYDRLVQSTSAHIPLEDASVGAVISNSVLEHVTDLNSVVGELSRILKPGGKLLITVPVKGFERHLNRYFGATEAIRINQEYYHRNLLESDEWRVLLDRHRLVVEKLHEYQSARFTFWYYILRFAGPRGLGFVFPNINAWLWRRFGKRMISAVRDSVAGATDGANVFVVARKL